MWQGNYSHNITNILHGIRRQGGLGDFIVSAEWNYRRKHYIVCWLWQLAHLPQGFLFKFTYCVKNYLNLTRLKGKLRYLPPFKGDKSYVAQGRGSMHMHKDAYLVIVNKKRLSTHIVELGKTLTPYLRC